MKRLLVVNAGSTSLKIRLIGEDDSLLDSWEAMPDELPPVELVAHRVVHGGTIFRGPTLIDADVEQQLHDLIELAPLHQPKALAAIALLRAALPAAQHVACFDTAFHADMPAAATTYALPRQWNETYRLRRFGFHGLSHAWVARRAPTIAPGVRRIVSCHLGGGASLAAIADGRSVDTTMGFTPLAGLVMASRCGDVDPGLLMWLAAREPDLATTLESRSGLVGLAGTGDMRELLRRATLKHGGNHGGSADDGSEGSSQDARLALDVYLHRLRQGIASMAASMGGLDACVFTGGVGENSAEIRRRALDGLEFLGLRIDDVANHGVSVDGVSVDADVSAPNAVARTIVVAAREDLEMAIQARACISQSRVIGSRQPT